MASNLEQCLASAKVYSIVAAAACSLESVEGPVSDAPLSPHKQRQTEMNCQGKKKTKNRRKRCSSETEQTDDKAPQKERMGHSERQ